MGKPSFDLGENEIELGIGVHGEPGVKRVPMMLADDIVYVQPNPEIARELLNDINPFITLLTTTVLVIGIVRGFSQ